MLRELAVLSVVLGIVAMPALALAANDLPPAEKSAGPVVSAQKGFTVLDAQGAAWLGGAIGAGIVVIGGAKGIGAIGGNAVEAMARQPEASGSIQVAMIITAAMIEGATLFAVVVCMQAVGK